MYGFCIDVDTLPISYDKLVLAFIGKYIFFLKTITKWWVLGK